MKKVVSFDFDGTLGRELIQEFAKELIKKGFEVWIVTSRSEFIIDKPDWNDDLFLISDLLSIPRERVIFTNGKNKHTFLPENCLLHLDDDAIELNSINRTRGMIGISCWQTTSWKNKCLKLIEKL